MSPRPDNTEALMYDGTSKSLQSVLDFIVRYTCPPSADTVAERGWIDMDEDESVEQAASHNEKTDNRIVREKCCIEAKIDFFFYFCSLFNNNQDDSGRTF